MKENHMKRTLSLDVKPSKHYSKEDSILAFNERILKMGLAPTTPLLERVSFLKIVHSNLLEWINARYARLSEKEKYRYKPRVSALFEEMTELGAELSCALESNNVRLLDPVLETKVMNLVVPDNGAWRIISDHYYALIIRSDCQNSPTYMVDIGTKYSTVNLPSGYYHAIVQFVKDAQYPYLNGMLEPFTRAEFDATQRVKGLTKALACIVWLNHDKKLNNQILGILQSRKLDIIQAGIDIMISESTLDKTKAAHPELAYPPIKQRYQVYDYEKELLTNQREFLFRTPNDSFDHVVDFINQCCDSPNVESVYLTLYRFAENNRILPALLRAAESGKKVFLFIELNARGDEDHNENVTRILQEYQKKYHMNVYSNYRGMKVHAKLFIAITKDKQVMMHCGTGNYNEKTSKQYVDMHYITGNPAVTSSTELLQVITGSSAEPVKPVYSHIERFILREISKGRKGRIRIKCNHVQDESTIELLNLAVSSGCKVEMVIRTTIPSTLDERIRIRSVVGKYLEHERIYMFGEGEDLKIFLSSADILYRNLYKRVESFVEIQNIDMKHSIEHLFDAMLK